MIKKYSFCYTYTRTIYFFSPLQRKWHLMPKFCFQFSRIAFLSNLFEQKLFKPSENHKQWYLTRSQNNYNFMLKLHPPIIAPLFPQYFSLFPACRFLASVLLHYKLPPLWPQYLLLQRLTKNETLDSASMLSLNKTRNTKDEISTSPKQNVLPQATTTHLLTIKALQTTIITRPSVSPPILFIRRTKILESKSKSTFSPPRRKSWITELKPGLANH